MDMKDMSVSALCALTASDAPAPGGGSISAMAGAYGAALASMVANLTLGRAAYEEAREDMLSVVEKTAELREFLLNSIQKDTASFDAVMTAMALPKGTDKEKAVRREAMQAAFKGAVAVPLSVAEKCVGAMPLVKTVLSRGNKNAVTDGLCAALNLRSGAMGALFNVRINLGSIKDEAFVRETAQRCDKLYAEVQRLEKEIFALAPELT